jgi:hypothetical protein
MDNYDKSPSGGFLSYTTSTSTSIVHSASCNKNTLTADFRTATAASADISFIIGSSVTTGGTGGSPVAVMRFKDGAIYAFKDGQYLNVSSYSQSLTEYSIVVDVDAQIYYLYYKDAVSGSFVKIYSGTLLSANVETLYSGYVQVDYVKGSVNIDYITVSGSGAKKTIPIPTPIVDKLVVDYGCSPELSKYLVCNTTISDLAFSNSNESAGSRVSAYPDVYTYCSTCNQDCNYDALRNIALFNQNCYRQAFNYCVDKAYPDAQNMISANSGDGILVCTSVFAIGTVTKKIAIPVIGDLWSIITANIWETMLFFVVIIVIAAVLTRKK